MFFIKWVWKEVFILFEFFAIKSLYFLWSYFLLLVITNNLVLIKNGLIINEKNKNYNYNF